MKYLVTAKIDVQIYALYIIGLAENKHEIYSLLIDFYNSIKKNKSNPFECDWLTYFDVTVYEISNNNDHFISQILDKYSDSIDDLKWEYSDYGVENFSDNFIFIPLENPEEKHTVFMNQTEVEIIKQIIKNSNPIF